MKEEDNQNEKRVKEVLAPLSGPLIGRVPIYVNIIFFPVNINIYRLDFLENVPFLQYVHGTLNLFLNDHTLLVDTGIGLGRASPTFCRSRAII